MSTSRLLLAALCLASFGCHAQVPAVTGTTLSPEVSRRLEVLLRQKATQLPPASTINIGPALPSELAGYSKVTISFTNDGKTSHPIEFLVSADGKTVGQFNKYDISADPRDLVSAAGRPSRGGDEKAPVLIVGFDDLQCPYCSIIHQSLFPAILQRYGDKVHFVYKDYPLPERMHPWAMHAAVDVNCMAAQSPAGYWNLVDFIHGHYSEIGAMTQAQVDAAPVTAEQKIKSATTALDKLTREQGTFQKVDMPKLDACIAKQDISGIEASQKIGDSLTVDPTPTLFINGDKVDGAVPLEFIFGIIDNALRAENIVPPPPYVAPAPPPVSITPGTAPATTPGKPAGR